MPTAAVRPARPAPVLLHLVAHVQRDRARTLVQRLPRRRAHVTFVRDGTEARLAVRARLVDAVLVDLGGADAAWEVAALAADVPTAPFFGILPWRSAYAAAVHRATGGDFTDIFADGVDDGAALDLIGAHAFSARFARAFVEPPAALRLERPLQRAVWQAVVAHAGRPVRTGPLAEGLGVTREHLSRAFAAGGAPNLKRVIDFVRLCAASAQAKNPGYDTGDVARVLGFASASHLATTTQRVLGLTPASLSRLRPRDLVEHFVKGHARSRG